MVKTRKSCIASLTFQKFSFPFHFIPRLILALFFPFRWLFFLLPAFVLASTAVGIYAGLETTANYKYLHSVWHVAIALCIPLFLPTVRRPKLYVDHRVNGDEYFGDSDESLLLNVRNSVDDTEGEGPESNRVTFPKLIT